MFGVFLLIHLLVVVVVLLLFFIVINLHESKIIWKFYGCAWALFGGEQGRHVPPTHLVVWGQNIWYPTSPTFWYFNIYLRFTVIFTGLIRTTCSHSTYIQIFWACTVYKGWEETEIRATMILIFQIISDTQTHTHTHTHTHTQTDRQTDIHTDTHTHTERGFAPTELAVSCIKYFYIPIVPPPHLFLANAAHVAVHVVTRSDSNWHYTTMLEQFSIHVRDSKWFIFQQTMIEKLLCLTGIVKEKN